MNEILGTEGNVRVLRVLSATERQMSRARVAERTQLNASGVRRILDGLAEAGLVEVIGSGRNKAVRLRDRHPLAALLRELFDTERTLFERIVEVANDAVATLKHPVDAVWTENRERRSPGTIDIGVLGDAQHVDRAVHGLEDRFREVEEELAVHFTFHACTEADLVVEPRGREGGIQDVTLLYGWIPVRWREAGDGPIRSHRALDERARRLGARIADLLPNDPAIVDGAVEWIDNRMEQASPREARTLREWRSILTQLSVPQIEALLRERSERAERLRQSLPFVEALSVEDRRRLLEDAA